MVIDIISYTDAQFASLNEEQILQIKTAQLKKNKLDANLEKTLIKEKQRLVENGTILSDLYRLETEKLYAQHDLEVEQIRESLLFYLQFSGKLESAGGLYDLDYSLTPRERFDAVKKAYEEAYADGKQRFDAFAADKYAPSYLGETYAPLYEIFTHY